MLRTYAAGWVFVTALLVACKQEKPAPEELAPPAASSLEAPKPASATGVPLGIDSAKSAMTFLMDSPLEKLDGQAPGSVSGELSVDLDDLTKSVGLVKVDLDKLVLYQQKRADESSDYGERQKSDKQNEHARDWLQIVAREGQVTPEQAAANRIAEFRIDKVETATPNVRAIEGAERKVSAKVSGDLRVHGRSARQSADVEIVFRFAGDKLESIDAKTVSPLNVSLALYEINPRDGAGKLLKSITDAVASSLKGKLQTEAPVMVEFSAKPK